MIYVKFGFSGLNIPKLVQYCKGIVIKMTANANYVTPSPSLGSVITPNITALENAYEAALDGGKRSLFPKLCQEQKSNKFDTIWKSKNSITSYLNEKR